MNTEVLATNLICSIIQREFGTPINELQNDYHTTELTNILGRMHSNKEVRIRQTLRDMVKLNKEFISLNAEEQDDVIFWMLIITFGNGFDLEYYGDGVLVNARAY